MARLIGRDQKRQQKQQENWAIAKRTARCTQYMSALKIVCKRKISQRLRKNLRIIYNLITIVNIASLFTRLLHRRPLISM